MEDFLDRAIENKGGELFNWHIVVKEQAKSTKIKELTKEQKEYIREGDNAINFIEEQLVEMGSYGEEKAEQEKAVEKIKDFKGDGSFEGWVRRIMVNTSIEFYRKNSRMLAVVDIDHAPETPIQENQLTKINMTDLLRIIQSLSPGYRMIFNMYAIEGYSHKEIAEQLGISEGTSKSQLNAAKSKLKELVRTFYYQKAK